MPEDNERFSLLTVITTINRIKHLRFVTRQTLQLARYYDLAILDRLAKNVMLLQDFHVVPFPLYSQSEAITAEVIILQVACQVVCHVSIHFGEPLLLLPLTVNSMCCDGKGLHI